MFLSPFIPADVVPHRAGTGSRDKDLFPPYRDESGQNLGEPTLESRQEQKEPAQSGSRILQCKANFRTESLSLNRKSNVDLRIFLRSILISSGLNFWA